MKKLLVFLCSAGLLSAQDPSTAESVAARSHALELAGAFANEGYKIRDGFWSGVVESGKPRFLQVNLFSGNEYWFSAATMAPNAKLAVALFDENGRLLEGEIFQDGDSAAAGIVAEASGKYFVRIELLGGDKADFCLVYSYK